MKVVWLYQVSIHRYLEIPTSKYLKSEDCLFSTTPLPLQGRNSPIDPLPPNHKLTKMGVAK